MASAFTHAFVALSLGKVYTAERMPLRFWVLSAACAVLPDADVIAFAFGIPYGDMLGHRGFTHSLLFALLTACAVVALAFRDLAKGTGKTAALVFYFFVVTASHAVLDALTNGGLGVAFFAPFDNTRYFFPVRPVEVSPIGVGSFFSERGLAVLASELLWLWMPSALIVLTVVAWRKQGRTR
ncbi:MAG TPA: metal-dependent hydrolase [Pyrinomonadaceae bacterium]|jgi:inner membrane protein|nr:metal-dependent hydrolase [Pyrinomonadaceae bacterium]